MKRLITVLLFACSSSLASAACDVSALGQLPDVRIDSVEQLSTPVRHCKVAGVIGLEINFELLLPDNWNGKFVMGGGGGFVGTVQNSALAYGALESGYATVGTDTGHTNSGIDASWALHNLERIVNFGHLAVHRTAVNARALLANYYGEQSRKNYFVGCSRGGGQALMEAQRYPRDFDAIVAGAPAYSWSGIAAQAIRVQQAMYPQPDDLSAAVISSAEQALLEGAILSRCDANDGLQDGILNDPRQCDFKVDELPSCSGSDNDECFTDAEKSAISSIYDGPFDDKDQPLFYGYPFGGESDQGGWSQWLSGGNQGAANSQQIPNAHFGFGTGIMKYLTFHDPQWDYSSYDFANFADDTATMAATLNATDPDLSAFRENGGKLLIYQGWSDAAISATATIAYYESVIEQDSTAPEDVKLFMMPGVLHCGGGKGPSQVNFLDAIDRWSESGVAPVQLQSLYPGNPGQPRGGRPLCQYPQVAQYDGSGDDRNPASFSCTSP